MNNQEAFNKVCAHLKNQNARSVKACSDTPGSTPRCSHAGENGRACAVGCLVPRELAEEMDALGDSSWDSISAMPRESEDHGDVDPDELEVAEEAISILKGVSDNLLSDLQLAHDQSDGEDFWGQALPRLRDVAAKYALEIPAELTQ